MREKQALEIEIMLRNTRNHISGLGYISGDRVRFNPRIDRYRVIVIHDNDFHRVAPFARRKYETRGG